VIQHPSLAVNCLIILGESFWVFSGSAQLLKLSKTKNTKGLAPISQTLNAAGNVSWATYFAVNHLWFPFASNIIVFLITSVTLGFTLSHRKKFLRGIMAIAIIGPLTSVILIKQPWLGGWIGFAYNWFASTPQLIKVMKHKKVSGLSRHSLQFAIGAMLCVLAYGIIIHSYPLMVGCLQGLVYTAIIFRLYFRHRHTD
jgi:uncharacterized protein with PQ loop repeat